ncbi:hypothetical protein Enr17x_10100 [Gimesia fumaroli]|uniref:N-acetyltransferase domain-containing protein n=1 Tax=Gimesia fumaroli TaxID=2527976 RepID=A0A518I7D1_9PLAN|nr:hypothetical protein Enr17x_10100 [Gimesia fumaroli]
MTLYMQRVHWCDRLYVSPEYRRVGVGDADDSESDMPLV